MADKSEAAVARKMRQQEREWQAQADLRTLAEANAIKKDAGRLAAAQDHARKQVEALRPLARRTPRK